MISICIFQPIVAELEKSINSVFELNEDGNLMKPPSLPVVRKGRCKSAKKKTSAKRKHSSDSEDEFEDSGKENRAEVSTRRSNRTNRKRVLEESDSD